MTLYELTVDIFNLHEKEEHAVVGLKSLLYAADALLEAINEEKPDLDQMETITGLISIGLKESYKLLEGMDETNNAIIKFMKATQPE